jgi:hypothetical protein
LLEIPARRSRCEIRLDHAASRFVSHRSDVRRAGRLEVARTTTGSTGCPVCAPSVASGIHAAVREVHAQSQAIYGSHKIARELARRDDLESACRNTVARAMRELGLKSRVSKAFTPTTTKCDPTKQPAPNLLDRDFVAEKPNQKWVTDITYLPTLAGWGISGRGGRPVQPEARGLVDWRLFGDAAGRGR